MIFRLRDYVLYPRAIWQEHEWLKATQYWAPNERRGWVQERLERTLTHAVRHVPWYRQTLGPFESQFPAMVDRLDISALPLVTKEIVRNHYDELRADDFQHYRPSTTETSGSTGTPTEFMLDAESNVHQFAAIWRVLNWAGYRFGQRYADVTGYLPRNDDLAAYDWRTNCLHISSYRFRKEHIPEYVRRLRSFSPVLIKAYPSALHLFCSWVKELGIDEYHPPAVLTCAESLLDQQRQLIGEVLRCPVFDFYNQNERAALISTCERGTYHVHEEYAVTEFEPTDDPGIRAIVATNLHNRAMPLIRYRTDDLAEIGPRTPCPCGRTYGVVNRIIGRVEDVVVTPEGRYVCGLGSAVKHSPGIRMSQMVQDRVAEIEVRIVRATFFSQSDLDRLEQELRARLGNTIAIRYTFVDHIPPGKNGKVKGIVSNLGQDKLGPLAPQ
jgi:phenylacetate-CoA ligase